MKRKKMKICPKCNGKGREYVPPDEKGNGNAQTGPAESKKCSNCMGLGKVPE